jgi:hypothetical protein
MADLPGVHETYEWAVLAELLRESANRVRRAPSFPAATDPTAMSAALATATVEVGVFVGDLPDHIADVVYGELLGVLAALYAAGEPVGSKELAGRLDDEIGLAPNSTGRSDERQPDALCVWWLRELLVEGGRRAPLPRGLAVASAGALVDGLQFWLISGPPHTGAGYALAEHTRTHVRATSRKAKTPVKGAV